MRFIESRDLERIGFDFYCDIAKILKKREREKDGLRKNWQKRQELQNRTYQT